MANRQQNLFAAEDWKIAYKAYSEIDFQAYDFDTIRGALVDYVRTNYPENFNDYIESSEFIAIIEMLAYLSQSLAFRMDVNTRENFIDTAESRDSVFKLARMLGYNPKRNIPASGLMKLSSVRTTEQLTDSLGTDLGNRTVYWDDSNNSQSYEQFITIMNAAMSKTNRFTTPIKQGEVGGIDSELYQFNTPAGSPIVYNFELDVNGVNRPFTVVNPDFEDGSHFYERHPDPTNLFNMIYRNDGKGISSDDTGFFVMFRQGTLNSVDFNYTVPVENRIEEVSVPNIGENDLYLQEIDSSGIPLNKWEKVPNTVGQTLNYNSKSLNTRNLYAVENAGTTGIRLRFANGNFGNVPVGIFRLWHRVSAPERYSIQPDDAQNISVSIPYQNAEGRSHSVTLTFGLTNAVNNSLPAESLEAIKERAPQVYYTQNRMVSAQDYNVFPQSQSSNIRKLKAINRTHAGHSRYIDHNDPTGTYHNIDTFADDAFLYIDPRASSQGITVNNTNTALEVVTSIMPAKLKELSTNNFVYYSMRNTWQDPASGGNVNNFKFALADDVIWNPLPIDTSSKTGYITERFSSASNEIQILNNSSTVRGKQFKENTFLKFVDPDNLSNYQWVRITNVDNNGLLTSAVNVGTGPFSLSEEIPAGWAVTETIVTLRKLFTTEEAALIRNQINDRNSFGLGYDLITDSWSIINNVSESAAEGEYSLNSADTQWVLLMTKNTATTDSVTYTLTSRGEDYVVQSKADLKFYNVKNVKVVDETGKSSQDIVTFTTNNTLPADKERFVWQGSTRRWLNEDVGTTHEATGLTVNLPLRSRDTNWNDVTVDWVSNFGILSPDNASTSGNLIAQVGEIVEDNTYVTDSIVPLNVYEKVQSYPATPNVVIQSNTGRISSIPEQIRIPFNATTFGENIVLEDSSNVNLNFITYRQLSSYNAQFNSGEVIFVGEVGKESYSYGTDGETLDPALVTGRLKLLDYDRTTEAGNLLYIDLQDEALHNSTDSSNVPSQDKLDVTYITNKAMLSEPIKWQIADVFVEPDGYTDARKVRVAPLDTDGDMVPDRPRQFAEYVGVNSLVLFEYYTDFDGYTYDRPVEGVILDYRNESTITVTNTTISPGSRNNPVLLSTVDWVLVGTVAQAEQLENITAASGIVVYVVEDSTVYQLVPSSSNFNTVVLTETTDYFVKHGRGKTQDTLNTDPGNGFIRWQHVAPNDVRVDPSISNVVEMVVLTQTYYEDVVKWKANSSTDLPLEPTSAEMSTEFNHLNQYKSASDTIVYRSAKFKILFGSDADESVRARFRVVRLSDQYSDNELKTRIISAMDEYFNVDNWEFGETFYFTELSTYIHQRLGSAIGSIVIMPKNQQGKLGELFQVQADPNELFISTATVNDIEIISRLDNQTLRTDR